MSTLLKDILLEKPSFEIREFFFYLKGIPLQGKNLIFVVLFSFSFTMKKCYHFKKGFGEEKLSFYPSSYLRISPSEDVGSICLGLGGM